MNKGLNENRKEQCKEHTSYEFPWSSGPLVTGLSASGRISGEGGPLMAVYSNSGLGSSVLSSLEVSFAEFLSECRVTGGVETTSFSSITTVFSTTTLSSLLFILDMLPLIFFTPAVSVVGALPPCETTFFSLAATALVTTAGACGDLTFSSGSVADLLWSSCIIAEIFFLWVSCGMLLLRGWSTLADLGFEGWSVKPLVLGSASFFNRSLDDSAFPLFSFFISVNDEVDLLTAFVLPISLLAFAVFGGWGSVPVVVLAGNFLRGEEDAGSASLTFELLYALGAFIM